MITDLAYIMLVMDTKLMQMVSNTVTFYGLDSS